MLLDWAVQPHLEYNANYEHLYTKLGRIELREFSKHGRCLMFLSRLVGGDE